MASLAEHARLYSELGWALVKLNGKMPLGNGWQNNQPIDPDSAASVFGGADECNMGLVLGPSGVIDFELDDGYEELYYSLVGDVETPCYITGSGKPHTLFRDPGGLSRRTREGFELRAGPHQSVLPPSIHPDTGGAYRWVNHPQNVPLADPPRALLDFFDAENGGRNEGNWREALRGEKLGKGQGRHASLLSYMGLAVNQFENVDQLAAAAIAYAAVTQDPPYDDETIIGWAERVWNAYREEPELEEDAPALELVTADKIVMRSVEFLWKPFIQRSAFHLLVGRKGAGKGSILAWLAAQMTVGWDGGDPRTVLWIATEDSFEIDVTPRFVAQGGDTKRLLLVQQKVGLPEDMPALSSVCRDYGVGLVVIDPIAGVFGGKDSNAEGPITDAIGGLNALADELDLAVVGVRHLGKNLERGALEAVLGNVAWVNIPRAVLGIAQEEDTKIATLEVLAGNRVRGNASFDFLIEEAKVPGVEEPVSKVVPQGESGKSVTEVLARQGQRSSKFPEVKAWVIELMEDNTPMTVEGIAQECIERFGVGVSTLQKVTRELKEEGQLRWLPREKDEQGRFTPGSKWYFQRA